MINPERETRNAKPVGRDSVEPLLELTGLQCADLIFLNETAPGPHRIVPVLTVERDSVEPPRHVIAPDLLDDCGPGQTFEHFGKFLRSLERAPGILPGPNAKTRQDAGGTLDTRSRKKHKRTDL